MGPLPGAREFLEWLRTQFQVVILSDTFYEFAMPLMRQLGHPTLFCHRLGVDAEGRIVNYHLRMPDQKRRARGGAARAALQRPGAATLTTSTAMLGAADVGILFARPTQRDRGVPQFPVTRSYRRVAAPLRGREHDDVASSHASDRQCSRSGALRRACGRRPRPRADHSASAAAPPRHARAGCRRVRRKRRRAAADGSVPEPPPFRRRPPAPIREAPPPLYATTPPAATGPKGCADGPLATLNRSPPSTVDRQLHERR